VNAPINPNPPNDPIVGTTVLGRYRVVARLAAGGMGVVYLARAEGAAGFAKPMVVKRILPEHTRNEDMARLFVREAKILSNLQHPNIVGVTDFGEEGGAYIMVLDYVRAYHLGLWLHHRIHHGQQLPVAGAIYIMIKVLEALEYAHTLSLPDGTKLDIIHSDISPSNVLVDTDGQVKLLDFGIARMRGETTKSHDAASIRGKLAYLPVEALDGSPPRVVTDVYACGVTLYELLAGEHPFQVDDETVTVGRVISHTPPPISQKRAEVPAELDAIVAKAMSRDRSVRYPSAKEFAKELRRILPDPDEVASTIAALVKQDYPEIAKDPKSGALPLAELEDAWRNAPAGPQSARAVIRPSLSDAAGIEFAPTDPNARPRLPAKRSPAVLILAFLALVIVGGGITAALVIIARRPDPDTDAKVILVEHTSTATNSSATVPVNNDPPPTTPTTTSSGTPATSVSGKPAPTKPGLDPLSAAFAKNQPAIETCFQSNASAASSAPEIGVRFSIDKEGSVQKAELIPADLTSTPLGECILGIAKRTQFPAQAAPATFRIPLKARRSNSN
jgi:serine/threonine-protein kinase